MKIRLTDDSPLDIKSDFNLNIQLTNPMLTDQGSMSLPMNLPASPGNLKMLGFPNRADRYYKLRKKIPVVIESGIMQKQAILEIMSYKGKEGIESVMLLNEAQMYTKMQEISMSTAFQTKRKAETFSIPGETISDPMDRLVKYMELVMFDQIQDDFHVFPIGIGSYTYTYTMGREPYQKTRDVTVYTMLNEQVSYAGRQDRPELSDTDLKGNKYKIFRGRRAYTMTDGREEYEVPKGYGITPFLKETYVLHKVFEYFGYQLKPSRFDTDPDLLAVVLLNNTADALVKGIVDYSQLVPNGTIHEYLETIRQRYGCEFFVSEDLKTVIPVFWKDILKSTSKKDFSDKVKGEPVIEYVTPKSLKLCYKRSIDNAAMSVDTWEKFEREYGKITDYLEEIPDRRNNGLAGYADGYYFIQSDCSIYELYTTMGIYGKNVREWRFIMKAMFDYYEEGDDIEYKEITSNLEYVPFIMGYNRYTDGDSVYHSDFGPSLRFPYVGSKRHLNTSLKVIVTDEKGDKTETEKKEDPGSCPIMAVFYRYTELVNVYNLKTRLGMGTMHRYDADGKVAGNLDLTFGGEHGLYETFWKEYNEVLKNSFIKLTFDLVLSELDIAAFRMNELYYIDGQPLLPELLEYTIDKNGIEANKAEFRTVRLYKNLEEE